MQFLRAATSSFFWIKSLFNCCFSFLFSTLSLTSPVFDLEASLKIPRSCVLFPWFSWKWRFELGIIDPFSARLKVAVWLVRTRDYLSSCMLFSTLEVASAILLRFWKLGLGWPWLLKGVNCGCEGFNKGESFETRKIEWSFCFSRSECSGDWTSTFLLCSLAKFLILSRVSFSPLINWSLSSLLSFLDSIMKVSKYFFSSWEASNFSLRTAIFCTNSLLLGFTFSFRF